MRSGVSGICTAENNVVITHSDKGDKDEASRCRNPLFPKYFLLNSFGSEDQRRIYAENAPYLYGLTVQLFTDDRESISSIEENGMPIKQLTPCYSTTVEHLSRVLHREYGAWDQKSPKFVAAQYSVWGELKPDSVAALEQTLKTLSGDRVEFIRADSFFKMMRAYYEKN